MSRIVEFVGIPGSGKTTLVSMVSEELESPVRSVRTSLVRRGWSKMITFARYWRVLVIAAQAMRFDRRSLARKARALRWVLSTLEIYRAPRTNAVVLIPEGSLQRALLLFFTPGEAVNHGLLQRYLEVAPVADVVVRLFVSPEEAARRNEVRKSDPSDGRPNPRFLETHQPAESALAEADSFIRGLLSEASRRPGVDVLTIESHNEVELSNAVHDILDRARG